MARRVDYVKAKPWQAHVERLDQRARRQFLGHQHVAENADALSGDDGFDRVQLLSEAQMLHVLELGDIAPLALCDGEPSLPGRSFEIGR